MGSRAIDTQVIASGGFFVTATDTAAGKTRITAGLMAALQAEGVRCAGLKPLASGAEATAEGLRNDDALILQRQASVAQPYEQVNPYVFAPAIAPHLAAAEAGVSVDIGRVQAAYAALAAQVDCVAVEGVGGWLVPLDERRTVADLAAALRLPVIVVVGLRLGCLNHALLTQEAIAARGLPVAGWVANAVDDTMERQRANVETLEQRFAAPLLGAVPRLAEPTPQAVADCLDVGRLLAAPAHKGNLS